MKRLFLLSVLLLAGLQWSPADAQSIQAPPSRNVSGTITTGGSFQQIAPSAPGTRGGCLIVNPPTATETLYVYFGPTASATTSNAYPVSAGGGISCGQGPNLVADAIQVEAATTGHAFVAQVQ